MLDIERELLADTFSQFDLVYSGRPLFAKLFLGTKLPWVFGKDEGEGTKKVSMVHRMAGMYDRHKASKNKEK